MHKKQYHVQETDQSKVEAEYSTSSRHFVLLVPIAGAERASFIHAPPLFPVPSLTFFVLVVFQVAGFDTFGETVGDLCSAVVSAELSTSACPKRFSHTLHSGSVSLRSARRMVLVAILTLPHRHYFGWLGN